MVIYCSVYQCNNNASNKDVSFFRFPYSNEDRCMSWWLSCKRSDRSYPGKGAYICSIHFREKDYIRDLEHELLNLPIRKRLSKEAIPCMFMPVPVPEKCSLLPVPHPSYGEERMRLCARSIHIQKRKRKTPKEHINGSDEPATKIFSKSLVEDKENKEFTKAVAHASNETALCLPTIPLSAVTVNCKVVQSVNLEESKNLIFNEPHRLPKTSKENICSSELFFTNCARIQDVPCSDRCLAVSSNQENWQNLERKLIAISNKTYSAFERLCAVAEMMYWEHEATLTINEPDYVIHESQQSTINC